MIHMLVTLHFKKSLHLLSTVISDATASTVYVVSMVHLHVRYGTYGQKTLFSAYKKAYDDECAEEEQDMAIRQEFCSVYLHFTEYLFILRHEDTQLLHCSVAVQNVRKVFIESYMKCCLFGASYFVISWHIL